MSDDPRVDRLAVEMFQSWLHINEPSRAVIRSGIRRHLETVDAVDPVRVACQRLVDEARDGRWNSSETCNLILAAMLGVKGAKPTVRQLMEALGTWDQ